MRHHPNEKIQRMNKCANEGTSKSACMRAHAHKHTTQPQISNNICLSFEWKYLFSNVLCKSNNYRNTIFDPVWRVSCHDGCKGCFFFVYTQRILVIRSSKFFNATKFFHYMFFRWSWNITIWSDVTWCMCIGHTSMIHIL